jgi:hypothetical protein
MRMRLWDFFDRRIKRFSIVDEKLAQLAAVFGALIIVRWYPHLLEYDSRWYWTLLVLCAIKPLYVFYVKK